MPHSLHTATDWLLQRAEVTPVRLRWGAWCESNKEWPVRTRSRFRDKIPPWISRVRQKRYSPAWLLGSLVCGLAASPDSKTELNLREQTSCEGRSTCRSPLVQFKDHFPGNRASIVLYPLSVGSGYREESPVGPEPLLCPIRGEWWSFIHLAFDVTWSPTDFAMEGSMRWRSLHSKSSLF